MTQPMARRVVIFYMALVLSLILTIIANNGSNAPARLQLGPAAQHATASRRVLVIAPAGEMTSNELEAFHNACQVWNTLIGRPVFLSPLGAGLVSHPDIWLTRVYAYDNSNTLAVTYYQYDMTLVSYAEYLKFNRPMLEQVLVHEFGHVLGLQHSKDPKSVMYPTIGEAFLPTPAEIRQVRADWNQEAN